MSIRAHLITSFKTDDSWSWSNDRLAELITDYAFVSVNEDGAGLVLIDMNDVRNMRKEVLHDVKYSETTQECLDDLARIEKDIKESKELFGVDDLARYYLF